MRRANKLLLTLTLITWIALLAAPAAAQPERALSVSFGGEGDQYAHAAAPHPDGVLLAGSTQDGDDTDAWIAVVAGNGSVLWTEAYGDKRDNEFRAVERLQDGYLAVGYTERLDHQDDFLVTRINDDGSLAWSESFGRSRRDRAHAATETGDGYVVAGDTRVKEEVTGGTRDYSRGWVVGVHPDGSMMWGEVYGKDDNHARGIASAGGGLVVAGYRELPESTPDLWAVGLDGEGNSDWSQATWSGHFEARSAAPSGNGFAVAGFTNRGMTDDYWLAEIDREGELVWDETYGTRDYESAKAMTGYREGFLLAGDHGRTDPEFWVVATDGDGKKRWDVSVAGGNRSAVTDVTTTMDGFAVAGYAETDDGVDARLVSYHDEQPARPPDSSFDVSPKPASVGEQVSFTASATLMDYTWSFGDGESATGRNASHVYDEPGNYTVTLRITDGDVSSTSSALVKVTASNQRNNASQSTPPEVGFAPGAPVAGEEVRFTASVEGEWAFGDGEVANGSTVTHTYGSAGNYTLEFKGNGSSVEKVVRVRSPVRTALEINYGPRNPFVGEQVVFTATPNEEEVNWRFGDGETARGNNVTHVYDEPGNYTVQASVNSNRVTSNKSVRVEVGGGSGLPGFGVLIALTALTVVFVYARLVRPT